MKIKNWKENQLLLSLSDYKKFYASLEELPYGERHSAIHHKLINLSQVWLNYDYENDTILIDKFGNKYSADLDVWAMTELAKTKAMLTELNALGVKSYSSTSSVRDGEDYFLGFLKMECVLRYRCLLAHSYRVEQR
jgi:hypothetical protein